MKDYLHASRRARWVQGGIIGFVILLAGGPIAWMGKEGVMVQYAESIVQDRLHLVQVPEPEMVRISHGTYDQGSRLDVLDESEEPVRQVTIKPFAMRKYEVTFEEYESVCGADWE